MTPNEPKRMTIEERAEHIVKIFMGYEKRSDKSFYDEVLIQITQACDEARAEANELIDMRTKTIQDDHNRCAHNADELVSKAYEKGFSDAIERAAKVAFESCENVQSKRICVCARNIRALKPEER